MIGAAPAFAQTAPLNLEKATRVSSRNTAVAPPVAYARTRTPDRFEDGQLPSPVGFLEMLFGGMNQAAPQYQFDPFERQERGYSGRRQQEASLETEQQERRQSIRNSPQTVSYNGPEKSGTIVIDTSSRFCFSCSRMAGRCVTASESAERDLLVGRETDFFKREWRIDPPDEMLARRPDLPHFMAGGPKIRWARARCILAIRSIASTDRMSRGRSAALYRPDAFGCAIRT
jgi:hypothetical protein